MKYKDLEKLPVNIIITDKQHTCVICGDRARTYDTDITEYICGEECADALNKFREAVQSS